MNYIDIIISIVKIGIVNIMSQDTLFTTITVSKETKAKLNAYKYSLGVECQQFSFDQIIQKLLEEK